MFRDSTLPNAAVTIRGSARTEVKEEGEHYRPARGRALFFSHR